MRLKQVEDCCHLCQYISTWRPSVPLSFDYAGSPILGFSRAIWDLVLSMCTEICYWACIQTFWYWACVQNFSLSTKRGRAHSDGCSKSSTQKYSASKLLKSMSWKVWEDVLNQKGQMALWVPLSWGCMAEIGVLTLVLHCWTLVCWNCCHTAKIGVALLKLVCCNWCCNGEIGVL